MVKYFSVDWLARSHHDSSAAEMEERRGESTEAAPPCRPHVPCVVQPRQPLYGKGYLQPKPKPTKPTELEPTEPCVDSPAHPPSCASPISEVSGYSSGYESEAASSECLSVDEGGEGGEAERDGPQRRVRTKFTPEQISRLEKIFNKHKYLDAGERVKTAQKLGLTETQVRTWFQNRRMKLKREVQDLAPHGPHAPQLVFQHLPPVQYHAVAGQRPHYPPAFYPALPVPQLVFQQQLPPHRPPHLMVHNPHFY